MDPDALREVESINLSSLVSPPQPPLTTTLMLTSQVFLKIVKHSTDILPPPPTNIQSDRNAPPPTALSAQVDAHGLLLGLDLEGVLEVEDAFPLPGGETPAGSGGGSGSGYSGKLIEHLRGVGAPDGPVGVYLSTANGGFVTRTTIDLLGAVEKMSKRGKAVLVIHDKSRSNGGELSVRGYRLSEGAREAARTNKWDSLA